MAYKKASEDINWLKDYCTTLENILKESSVPYVERCEISGKLRATREQIRQLERK